LYGEVFKERRKNDSHGSQSGFSFSNVPWVRPSKVARVHAISACMSRGVLYCPRWFHWISQYVVNS
jgi:hypothetical protein